MRLSKTELVPTLTIALYLLEYVDTCPNRKRTNIILKLMKYTLIITTEKKTKTKNSRKVKQAKYYTTLPSGFGALGSLGLAAISNSMSSSSQNSGNGRRFGLLSVLSSCWILAETFQRPVPVPIVSSDADDAYLLTRSALGLRPP